MIKLLVIFHLYYEDQLDCFLDRMRFINGCEWDLLVTGPQLGDDVRKRISAFKPGTEYLVTSNVGYDIWPFIAAVKSVRLESYDLLLKLHTKNSNNEANRVNGIRLKDYEWRDFLLDGILRDSEVFRKALDAFNNTSVGLVCNRSLLKEVSNGLYEDLRPLEEELGYLGITTEDRHFCAGTMFMARALPYKILQGDKVVESKFAAGVSHARGSMAHIYERIISILVADAGYVPLGLSVDAFRDFRVRVHDMFTPVLSWVFALSRKGEESHKYLTIFGFDIKIAD